VIRERGAAALYGLLSLFAVGIAATPFSRGLQGSLMAAQHISPRSMPAWVAAQLTPKMYGFAHRVWITDEPLTEELPDAPAIPIETYWLNHYPGRMSFEMKRPELAARGQPVHVFVRSSYRGLVRRSAFVSNIEDGRLVIRRRELE
jgi:hypothetical protein